jgi:non-lysosomal glucosylceramidase
MRTANGERYSSTPDKISSGVHGILVILVLAQAGLFVRPAFSRTSADSAKNVLSELEFRNLGIVTRAMHFEYLDQPLEYAEDTDYWNVTRRAKYLYQIEGVKRMDPPTGMRSAVPLGGLGSGTVELRADGSFYDWNIFNNSPASGNKIQIDDTFFGLRVQQDAEDKSWVLRTQPSADLPAIDRIEYSGEFPVSRLRYSDPSLPVEITLYAYSEFHPQDAAASAAPAAIFTFEVFNPSDRTAEVSLLFNVRNSIEGRLSSGTEFSLVKSGDLPTSGTMAVRAGGDKPIATTVFTGSNLREIWSAFSTGTFRQAQNVQEDPRYVNLAVTTAIPAKQSREVTYVLAWYFPNRSFKDQRPGNYYTRLYSNADDVASKVLDRLSETQKSIKAWQAVILQNSLPDWLQDSLVNSVATMYKTGMRLEDGRWRQWESFSCAGLDPVHIDFYRILPYAFFFPELQEHLLSTHAKFQQDDGFIHEQLTTGCFSVDSHLDEPGGREMGDSASSLILEAWQIYSWSGDRVFLDSIWPNVKKAAEWQIRRSETYGLPQKLENTYDWWQFGEKDLVSYNGFLHLSAMLAAEKLADVENDSTLAQKYRAAFQKGQESLSEHFWTGEYFRSWWLEGKKYPDALHSDTLYGQLWAFILDLGLLVDETKINSHLESEQRHNGSPFGLKVMRNANPLHPELENIVPPPGLSEPSPPDNMIWQAGSLDWTSLNLYMGKPEGESLGEAEKIIRNWRDRMRDQWDYTDTTTAWDGYLWCNSHYARQLIFWSIPLALSGQHYYAPDGRLTFDPKVAAPAKLPFFTPQAGGEIELLGQGRYRLSVAYGNLRVKTLRVDRAVSKNPISLQAGDSVIVKNE